MECEIVLIDESTEQDEDGFQSPTEIRTEIYAKKKSVKRTEFYDALKSGVKAAVVFEVFTHDYNDQRIIEHDEVRYKVERTYGTAPDKLELTCSEAKRK